MAYVVVELLEGKPVVVEVVCRLGLELITKVAHLVKTAGALHKQLVCAIVLAL